MLLRAIIKSGIPHTAHLRAEKQKKRAQRGYCEQSVKKNFNVDLVQWYQQKPVILASANFTKVPDNCS